MYLEHNYSITNMIHVPASLVETTVPTKVVGTTAKRKFYSRNHCRNSCSSNIIVETATKDFFVSTILVETNVHPMIIGTVVPTFIGLTAYYWKSCHQDTGTPVGLGCLANATRCDF